MFKTKKFKCPKCGATMYDFSTFPSAMCEKCQVPMKSSILNNIMDLLDNIAVVRCFKK